ncbi:MAG: IS66 family insertion sequence element accessory protein TnpB [Lentisphaeria bacterium]|nr:IS66 family insertion sequence element accessory protein TnpB [Lentisphaeria bacterium]
MLAITPQMRILVAVEPADFRKGIDGLAGVCRNVLREDPFSGCVFVFRNRRATAIKILVYDGQGFWLCQKRLSKGRFQWWPASSGGTSRELDARDLQLVVWNGDPTRGAMKPMWRGLRMRPEKS